MLDNPIKESDFTNVEGWLDYFSRIKKHRYLEAWLNEREIFYYRYFVIDEIECITVCDKETRLFQVFEKSDVINEFKIYESKSKKKKVKLLSFLSFELIKKVGE